MKKPGLIMLILLLLSLAGAPAVAAETAETAETGEEPAEWTVMFYFCGSDLESKYGYASGNLNEISNVTYPGSWLPMVAEFYHLDPDSMGITDPGKVNVLVETGGSKEWHTGDEDAGLDMDIDTGALQRWRYNVYPDGGLGPDGPWDGYELLETLPLQSMASPETLTDFIRWGAETCPAKKYALVLWGHGGGAMTGLFIDELFGNDVMYLYELKEALRDGGVRFETLLIDACLMANIETAWSVREYANWMVASEEVVPGKGTAVGDWLQALYAYPDCDGEWLGRCICDMTGIKYANEEEEMAKSVMTWSVIDLSKIDRLVKACAEYFRIMADALVRYPSEAVSYTDYIFEAETYGDGSQKMHDLGAVVYNPSSISNVNLRVRGDLMDALSDAVTYIVRGPGRNAARGLSFCYPANCSSKDLDLYAKNCPMPQYLAYIDAISPSWTAPDWVYEKTERLPSIEDIEGMQIVPVKTMTDEGMPALTFGDTEDNVKNVYYRMYRLDERTGKVVRLGRTSCGWDYRDFDIIWHASDPLHWPAVDKELCCIDLVQESFGLRLYDIPVQINSRTCILRCGREILYEDVTEKRYSEYEVYGVWEGFDENSRLLNRSVEPLAMVSGQEYRLLYPVKDAYKGTYVSGNAMTMTRALDVREIPLPEGTYYIEYEVQDMFMRSRLLEPIEFQWDGQNMIFPEKDVWEEGARAEFVEDNEQ